LYTKNDTALCRVFDMLMDRLDKIESLLEKNHRAQEYASDLSPKGTILSGLLHSDLPLQIKKMYDGILHGDTVIVDMTEVMDGTETLATKEWALGEVKGRYDTELRTKWGDETFERFKMACAQFFETHDEDDIPKWKELDNCESLGGSWPKESYVHYALHEIALKQHVPELFGLGPWGMMFRIPKNKRFCMRDIINLVRRVIVLLDKGDVPHNDYWEVYVVNMYTSLARAILRSCHLEIRHGLSVKKRQTST